MLSLADDEANTHMVEAMSQENECVRWYNKVSDQEYQSRGNG